MKKLAAAKYHAPAIWGCRQGKQKTSGGYHWRYATEED